jgi:hypothetical protein
MLLVSFPISGRYRFAFRYLVAIGQRHGCRRLSDIYRILDSLQFSIS